MNETEKRREEKKREKRESKEGREDLFAHTSDPSESMAEATRQFSMTSEICTNEDCLHRQAELNLARLREDLLNNFNGLLLDRIRFLEQTITRLCTTAAATSTSTSSGAPIRRCSSATPYFLPNPNPIVRSCPSSVDLSANPTLYTLNRSNSGSERQYLAIPIHSRPWTSSTSDIPSSIPSHEKTRLESRRFACDVDDNDIRALKAMVYMERARKAHLRPLHRLRQVFGIR